MQCMGQGHQLCWPDQVMHERLLFLRRIIWLEIVGHITAINTLGSASTPYTAEGFAVTGATGGLTVDELSLRDGEWSVSRHGIRLGEKKVLHQCSCSAADPPA